MIFFNIEKTISGTFAGHFHNLISGDSISFEYDSTTVDYSSVRYIASNSAGKIIFAVASDSALLSFLRVIERLKLTPNEAVVVAHAQAFWDKMIEKYTDALTRADSFRKIYEGS